MQRFALTLSIVLLGLSAQAQTDSLNARLAGEETEWVLVGPCNREGLAQAPFNDHFVPAEAYLEEETAAELQAALKGHSIILYLGTWCEDSHLQVPALLAVLDAAGFPTQGEDPDKWQMICTNEQKTEPAGVIAERSVEYVPTLVLLRGEDEVGRIVETPEVSWAQDILRLLR